MPYDVQYADNSDVWRSYHCTSDGAHAGRLLKQYQSAHSETPVYRWRIRKLRDDGLPDDWKEREQERFTRGDYEPVPWADADWYQPFAGEHFCHLSLKQPGKIAYTENAAKGEQDRQTIVGPGRYLTKFFKDKLTPSEIEELACRVSVDADACGMKITQDADEIEEVYVNGPSSCMSGDDFSTHPARVYAGPDLALAYTGAIDDASGRAVVWPEKKLYSDIYGDCTRLKMLLTEAGYTYGRMVGARVRKIAADNGYVMPYVDGVHGAEVEGEFIRLGSGSLCTQNTCGATNGGPECANCGNIYDEDDGYYIDEVEEVWCDSCAADTTRCEVTGERYRDDSNTFVEVHSLIYQNLGWSNLIGTYHYGYALGSITANQDNCTEDNNIVEVAGEYWTLEALAHYRSRPEAAKRGWETRRLARLNIVLAA